MTSSEIERQRLLQGGREFALHFEPDAIRGLFGQITCTSDDELHVEQFIEREPATSRFPRAGRGRFVQCEQRLFQWKETYRLANIVREDILNLRNQPVDVIGDQPANDTVTETLGCGIHRKDQALRLDIPILVSFSKNHELARSELSSVIELDRPCDQQELTRLDRAIEKRLTRPGTLDDTARVLQHRSKDPQATARRHDRLGNDATNHGDVATDTGLANRGHGRCIEVPVRGVIQQVLGDTHT